jgi:hypothetical protein
MTFSITTLYLENHYAECRNLFIVMPNAIMMSAVKLNAIMLSAILLSSSW